MLKSDSIMIRKRSWNPHLIDDLVNYLDLKSTKAQVRTDLRAMEPVSQRRVDALIDRLEFTHHLAIVSEVAKENGFRLGHYEVVGIDTDILALRAYLLLTCVDICVGRRNKVAQEFKRAFGTLSDPRRIALETHLTVSGSNSITDIAKCLYGLRCGYTHSGFRFTFIGKSTLRQAQLACDDLILEIAAGFDLLAELKNVVADIARRAFGLA